MDLIEIGKALSSQTRLNILSWLKNPHEFTSRREGDLSANGGVCVSLIADRAGISQPTASRHLETLRRAGLVYTERVAQWNFHYRDENGIEAAQTLLGDL